MIYFYNLSRLWTSLFGIAPYCKISPRTPEMAWCGDMVLETMDRQETISHSIRPSGIVVQIDTMPRVWMDIRLEGANCWEFWLRGRRRRIDDAMAVAPTESLIVLARKILFRGNISGYPQSSLAKWEHKPAQVLCMTMLNKATQSASRAVRL